MLFITLFPEYFATFPVTANILMDIADKIVRKLKTSGTIQVVVLDVLAVLQCFLQSLAYRSTLQV